jgi:hypothetical protein
MTQLDLFDSAGVHCLGMTLPQDCWGVSAPVQVLSRALCMPASAARLSLCALEGVTPPCHGGVWLWGFQNPATGQGEPWPLCSAHELLTCRCSGCQRPMSPYAALCERCMGREYEA